MKSNILHKIFVIGIVLISGFSMAQNRPLNEESNLTFQNYFFEALKQKAINNYSKAIENLEKCYEIDSANKAVFFELSKNYLELKKYFEAELFVDKALEKEPNNKYLLTHKVEVLKAQRNFVEAIEIQKGLMASNPKYSDALVVLYLQNSDFEKAKELINEIYEKGLATLQTKNYNLFLENRNKVSVAENLFEQAANHQNNDVASLKKKYAETSDFKTLQLLLELEEKEALFNELYEDSNKALELFPAQPYLYKANGLALNKLKKYNEAISVLTIGIDFVIDNVAMEIGFYEQLIIAYQGLNIQKEVAKYKQKMQDLRQRN
jgi:tetratricopeptide (TPR) repeat protein